MAYAGGAWYPCQVTQIISEKKAVIEYIHPITRASHAMLPENVKFSKPTAPDLMATDADSVFMCGFNVKPVSSRRQNTLILSIDVSVLNNQYTEFAQIHNIPLH